MRRLIVGLLIAVGVAVNITHIAYSQTPSDEESLQEEPFKEEIEDKIVVPRYHFWIPSMMEECRAYNGLVVARDLSPLERKVAITADKPAITFFEGDSRGIVSSHKPAVYTLPAFKNHLIFGFKVDCNVQEDIQFRAVVEDNILIANSTIVLSDIDRMRLKLVLPDQIFYDAKSITGFIMLEDSLGNVIRPEEDIIISLRASDDTVSLPRSILFKENHWYEPFNIDINAYKGAVEDITTFNADTINATNTNQTGLAIKATIYAGAEGFIPAKKDITVIKPLSNLRMNIALLPKYMLTNDFGYVIGYITDKEGNLYTPEEPIKAYFAIANSIYASIIKTGSDFTISKEHPYAIARIQSKGNDGIVDVGVASMAGYAVDTLYIGATIDQATMNVEVTSGDNSTNAVIDFKDDEVIEEITLGEEEEAFALAVRRNNIYHYTVTATDGVTASSITIDLTPIESAELRLDTVNATRYGMPFLTAISKVNRGEAVSNEVKFTYQDSNGKSYRITLSDILLESINPLEITPEEVYNTDSLGITASVKHSLSNLHINRGAVFRDIMLFEKAVNGNVRVIIPTEDKEVKINYLVGEGKGLLLNQVGRFMFIYFTKHGIVTDADSLDALGANLRAFRNVYLASNIGDISLVSDYAIEHNYIVKQLKLKPSRNQKLNKINKVK